MKRFRLFLIPGVLLSLSLTACKDKGNDTAEAFNKEPIMSNLADNYILPGYQTLQTETNTLQVSWNQFLADQSAGNLLTVQNAWKTANLAFHEVKLFDVGPAMTIGLANSLGTFPADTTQIENNIVAGTYNLGTVDNVDAIGFDALDYLLFRSNALAVLQTNSNTRLYISAVIQKMKSEVDTVTSQWNAGYRATFIAGTGTASTSPFSLLINSFCKDFELAKTAKLGIPIGTQSLGIQQPFYLEARRSGFGKELLRANIQAVYDVFRGIQTSGSNGTGFDDYLSAIERQDLTSAIATRFDYMLTESGTWNGSIEDMMASNPQALTNFYNYMQGSVVYFKTDMSSSFGVLITYQDNDGD